MMQEAVRVNEDQSISSLSVFELLQPILKEPSLLFNMTHESLA